jgi:hypothetical protein
MTRTCIVCASAHRMSIDLALSHGASLRDIASRYGVGKDAVARHHASHQPVVAPAPIDTPRPAPPPAPSTPGQARFEETPAFRVRVTERIQFLARVLSHPYGDINTKLATIAVQLEKELDELRRQLTARHGSSS